jgi:hypothetical protein
MRKEFALRYSALGYWWYGTHYNAESEQFESVSDRPRDADRFTRGDAQQLADSLNDAGARYEWSVERVTP